MKRIFILGNGVSRKDIPVDLLKDHGIVIACNAAYRDFDPDYLVAVDSAMIKEIKASGWEGRTVTRREGTWNEDTLVVPCHRNVSGLVALLLAQRLGGNPIYFIGYDSAVSSTRRGGGGYGSNIYKGTNSYNSTGVKSSIAIKWNRWYADFMRSDIDYYRVVKPGTSHGVIAGSQQIDIDEFLAELTSDESQQP